MSSTQTSSPESSSDSLPPGSYSNNSDIRNSLNTTKIVQTVNNYFGNYPGRPSTSHPDCHPDFFPPSRSGLASITDVSEEEPDAASSIDIGDRETSLAADAGALVNWRQDVRFSQDAHFHKQEEVPKTYLAAYEYDMDAPGRIHASDFRPFDDCDSRKSLAETVGSTPTKGSSNWTLTPVTVKNFNNSKTIPPIIRTYMRSDFFRNSRSIALYVPSPGVNHNRRRTEKNIAIGDVGVFTLEGGFEVFFNIFMTEGTNKEYGYHPPPNFVPCATVTNDNIRKTHLRVRQYVQGDFRDGNLKEYVFSCGTHCTRLRLEGSALVLPMGGWKFTFTLAMAKLIENYMNIHAAHWYRHYRSTQILPSGSLKIVNTTYKSATWALAVGIKDVTTREKRLFANLSRPDQDEDVFDWKEHDDNVSVEAGPSVIEMGGPKATLLNQCVAVEVFAIKPTPLLSTLNATLTRLSLLLSPK